MNDDPYLKAHPERATPAPKLRADDSPEVVDATKAVRDLRKLAELAGGPVDQLKEV